MRILMRTATACLLLTLIAPVWGAPHKEDWEERQSFGRHFREARVNGCFLLYDLKSDKFIGYDFRRVNTPFIPASTYKIFNSLVIIETGIVRDENETLKWDGIDRGSQEWNQDLSMKTAFKYSATWFYQEMARRVGKERMQRYLDAANYGNKSTNGGIDRFWLDGGLRITPREQIDFLVKLYRNELPFSRRSMDIVRNILISEKTKDYVLRAKTGWGSTFKPQVGWWVGYVEKADNVYFFALNIDINKDEDAKTRKIVAGSILRELNVIN